MFSRVSYIVPLDSFDLDFLTRQAESWDYTSRRLWSREVMDGESCYYNVEILAKDGDENDGYFVPSDTFACHFCNIQVPKQYSQQHENSEKHQNHRQIFEKVLERMSKQIKQNFTKDNYTQIKEPHYFCETCCKLIEINEKYNHEMSNYHKKANDNDAIVKDFIKIFKNENDFENEPEIEIKYKESRNVDVLPKTGNTKEANHSKINDKQSETKFLNGNRNKKLKLLNELCGYPASNVTGDEKNNNTDKIGTVKDIDNTNSAQNEREKLLNALWGYTARKVSIDDFSDNFDKTADTIKIKKRVRCRKKKASALTLENKPNAVEIKDDSQINVNFCDNNDDLIEIKDNEPNHLENKIDFQTAVDDSVTENNIIRKDTLDLQKNDPKVVEIKKDLPIEDSIQDITVNNDKVNEIKNNEPKVLEVKTQFQTLTKSEMTNPNTEDENHNEPYIEENKKHLPMSEDAVNNKKKSTVLGIKDVLKMLLKSSVETGNNTKDIDLDSNVPNVNEIKAHNQMTQESEAETIENSTLIELETEKNENELKVNDVKTEIQIPLYVKFHEHNDSVIEMKDNEPNVLENKIDFQTAGDDSVTVNKIVRKDFSETTELFDNEPNVILDKVDFKTVLHEINENYHIAAKLPVIETDSVIIENTKGEEIKIAIDNFNSYRNLESKMYCQLCRLFVTDAERHSVAIAHVKNILQPVNEYFLRMFDQFTSHCLVCNDLVLTQSQHHNLNEDHNRLLNAQIKKNPNDKVFCAICQKYILAHNFAAHSNSKKHKKDQKPAKVNDKAQKIKNVGQKLHETVTKVLVKKKILTKINDQYFCAACKFDITNNLFEHISIPNHLDRNLKELEAKMSLEFCTICEVKVPRNGMLLHIQGRPHLAMIKEIKESVLNAHRLLRESKTIDQKPVKNTQQKISKTAQNPQPSSSKKNKTTTDNNLHFECKTCDLLFPKDTIKITQTINGIQNHLQGSVHLEAQHLCNFHRISYKDGIYCSSCETSINETLIHIDTRAHLLNLLEKNIITKANLRLFIYGNSTDNLMIKLYKRFYVRWMRYNKIEQTQNCEPTQFLCRMCNIKMNRVSEIDHSLTEKHIRYLKSIKG